MNFFSFIKVYKLMKDYYSLKKKNQRFDCFNVLNVIKIAYIFGYTNACSFIPVFKEKFNWGLHWAWLCLSPVCRFYCILNIVCKTSYQYSALETATHMRIKILHNKHNLQSLWRLTDWLWEGASWCNSFTGDKGVGLVFSNLS